MLRNLILLVLAMHGVGHVLFLANTWGYWTTESGRSWLFDNALGLGRASEGIVGLLWLIPLAGFLAGAWGLFTQYHGATSLLMVSAAISLVLVVAWWGDLVPGSTFGALVVDLAVIGLLLARPELLAAANS